MARARAGAGARWPGRPRARVGALSRGPHISARGWDAGRLCTSLSSFRLQSRIICKSLLTILLRTIGKSRPRGIARAARLRRARAPLCPLPRAPAAPGRAPATSPTAARRRRRRGAPPAARPPACRCRRLAARHERARTRRGRTPRKRLALRATRRAPPRWHVHPVVCGTETPSVPRLPYASAAGDPPPPSAEQKGGEGKGWQRSQRAAAAASGSDPLVFPTSPHPWLSLSATPFRPASPLPTPGRAAAAARLAAGRGGQAPSRLSRARRAELGRRVGRPQAARAQRLPRQRPHRGHGPARRRLSRHGAAGRRRAVQEHPATRRKPPPIAVPSEASPPPALTETEPVITAPSSPVAGIAGAGGGALDGGRTWLGLEDK